MAKVMVYDEAMSFLWILDLVLARMSILDVILRLSESTIEYQSFYIGFTMELMVKVVVYDETMTFVRFFVKNRCCF